MAGLRIIPVPLHPIATERGFNQALELAYATSAPLAVAVTG
ncbi:MAG: hypothetical protein U1F42_10450 [Candidatus Competibacteraceae bacterium]